jgi:thiamine pyrophosphokinase
MKMTVLTPGREFVIFSLVSIPADSKNKDYEIRIVRAVPELSTNGVKWPVKNSFSDVTFEVRKD